MKSKKYHTKIVQKGKIETLCAQIHDRSLSWLGTGTTINSDGDKLEEFVCLMVLNATFNNISVISMWLGLLVEENGGPTENHRPVASH